MRNEDMCTVKIVHKDVVENMQKRKITGDNAEALAMLFKTMGDPTRIKILNILLNYEACVCDIAEITGMSQSAISHQLRVLKMNRIVKSRKDGKSVFYSLDDNHVKDIFYQGMNHIME